MNEADDNRAAEIGRSVLAAVSQARAIALREARTYAAPFVVAVRSELDRDILLGHSSRGRAGRIARRLPGFVTRTGGFRRYTERHVLRALKNLDILYSMSNFP